MTGRQQNQTWLSRLLGWFGQRSAAQPEIVGIGEKEAVELPPGIRQQWRLHGSMNWGGARWLVARWRPAGDPFLGWHTAGPGWSNGGGAPALASANR